MRASGATSNTAGLASRVDDRGEDAAIGAGCICVEWERVEGGFGALKSILAAASLGRVVGGPLRRLGSIAHRQEVDEAPDLGQGLDVVVEGQIGNKIVGGGIPDSWNYYEFSDGTGTIPLDFEDEVPAAAFQRFFDSLSPAFAHMISLGQSNTIVSCPALTTHSELDEGALAASGIGPATIRLAIGKPQVIGAKLTRLPRDQQFW